MSFQFLSARSLESNLDVWQCKNFEQLNILKKNQSNNCLKVISVQFSLLLLKILYIIIFFR